jgi:GntR family transcriptional repressor for pyruvate dehydrogenase complex
MLCCRLVEGRLRSDASEAPQTLARAARRKLSEEVARKLLHDIRERRIERGTRMPSERELMRRLKVGRSTIREVINGLAILGVLEIRHGQGAFVLDPHAGLNVPKTLATALARGITDDLLEARLVIEVQTARLAAARRTGHDLAELDAILALHAQALTRDTPAVEHAVHFHERLAWTARNEMLARAVECFSELLTERGPALEACSGYRMWEMAQHQQVLSGVRAADSARAAAAMATYLHGVVAWHARAGPSRPHAASRVR